MKRLRRWLFNLAAGGSLLMCAAAIALWLVNCWTSTSLSWTGSQWSLGWLSQSNLCRIEVILVRPSSQPEVPRGWHGYVFPESPGVLRLWNEIGRTQGEHGLPRLGIAYSDEAPTDPVSVFGDIDPALASYPIYVWNWDLFLPHWLIILATSVLPLLWIARYRKSRHRRQVGHCSICGYDLRYAGTVPGMRGDSAAGERGGDMKRPRRWLFNLAAGVSLAAWMLTLLLLTHSFWALDEIRYPPIYGPEPSYEVWIAIKRGEAGIVLGYYRDYFLANVPAATQPRIPRFTSNPYKSQRDQIYQDYLVDRSIKRHFGFAFHREDYAIFGATNWFVGVPLWAVAVMTAVMPIAWCLRHQMWRRRALRGLCIQCGYDLRATPDRCPECGAVPQPAKGAAI